MTSAVVHRNEWTSGLKTGDDSKCRRVLFENLGHLPPPVPNICQEHLPPENCYRGHPSRPNANLSVTLNLNPFALILTFITHSGVGLTGVGQRGAVAPRRSRRGGRKAASPKYFITNEHKTGWWKSQKWPIATNSCYFGCQLVKALVIALHFTFKPHASPPKKSRGTQKQKKRFCLGGALHCFCRGAKNPGYATDDLALIQNSNPTP